MRGSILSIIFLVSTLTIHSQNSRGVKFQLFDNWEDVIRKASYEKKYILVDCYADWCLPCKEMDKRVYSDSSLGQWVNERFISMKVNFDDKLGVQSQDIVNYFKKNHRIESFPTLLFFTLRGEPIHKTVGGLDKVDFRRECINSLDPKKQIFTQVKNIDEIKKDMQKVIELEEKLKQLSEDSIANRMMKLSVLPYLRSLSESELSSKNYLDVIISHFGLVSSSDKLFHLVHKNALFIDNLYSFPLMSLQLVSSVINKEVILPRIAVAVRRNCTPDWDKINSTIKKKFGVRYADFVLLDAKLKWSEIIKDWDAIVKYTITKTERNGIDSVSIMGIVSLNNMIYGVIFKHSHDLVQLNKGAEWMEIVLRSEFNGPLFMDTYANILYKMGKRNEAINIQKEAIALDELESKKNNIPASQSLKVTLVKMESGEPTWPVSESSHPKAEKIAENTD